RYLLRDPYSFLNDQGDFDAIEIKSETSHVRNILGNTYAHLNAHGGLDSLYSNKNLSSKKQAPLTDDEIENTVRELQIGLWRRRHDLFPGQTTINPMELLNPSIAIEFFGYRYIESEYIGEYYSYQ